MKKNLIIVVLALLLFVTPVLADDYMDNTTLIIVSYVCCAILGLMVVLPLMCLFGFNYKKCKASNDILGMEQAQRDVIWVMLGYVLYMFGISICYIAVKMLF